ncbi:hypothetical protein ACRBEV_11230 [Methylobacterium phyllosphaerae]
MAQPEAPTAKGAMAYPSDPSCLYMRRLNEMMAFRPSLAILYMEVALFRRLQAFEVEARAAGAPGGTLGAIAAARSAITLAAPRHWLPVPRGH